MQIVYVHMCPRHILDPSSPKAYEPMNQYLSDYNNESSIAQVQAQTMHLIFQSIPLQEPFFI